ncbi:MAG: c-type cytochrome [Planctomycetota bacterium]|jgi:mono/diheme cytochrome c family protein
MPQQRLSPTDQREPSRTRRRIVVGVVAVLALLALLVAGRGILAVLTRQMAVVRMEAWAVSKAQWWLAWSAWLDPDNSETSLMQAACFRHLEQIHRLNEALQMARHNEAPAARVQREAELCVIQWGASFEGMETQLSAMIEAGASPHDVLSAYALGFLRRGDFETAKTILDAWTADFPEEAHVAYMWGVYCERSREPDRAQAHFEDALAKQPRHELASAALAKLSEDRDRLDEALDQQIAFAARAPESLMAQVGLARVLRKTAHLDEARHVLESPASQPNPPPVVAVEVGQIELESGNYEEAERWWRLARLRQTSSSQDTMLAAATTFALLGKTTRAERLFQEVEDANNRSRRMYDLRVRLDVDPADAQATVELQSLVQASAAADLGVAERHTDEETRLDAPPASPEELYAQHCNVCHGADGSGNGRAARHLFPMPKDLRTGKFQLVSTRNGVPTMEDLDLVIRRGMPGTSMPSFDSLSNDQRRLLAGEVLRLNRNGVRQFVDMLRSKGEEIDEKEGEEIVDQLATPGEVVQIPSIGAADAGRIARGEKAYFELGCNKCHGADGAGAPDTPLFDDQGRPARARDLVHEPFKGGHEPDSVYLRIFVGMPGTPHPACWNVPEEQIVALVDFCRSLSREPKRGLTNHQRSVQATSRAYLSAWGLAPPAPSGDVTSDRSAGSGT